VAFGAVCISSQDGAEAEETSRLVAEQLGYRLINEDIVARAAVEADVSPDTVADVERRKSLLVKILEGLGPAGMASGALMMPPQEAGFPQFANQELREAIRSVIEETAAAGKVVIVAHAASLALTGRDDVFRVLVIASPPTRQRRLAESLHVDESEAANVMKRSDAGRADYIKRFYGINSEQPSHYDLVINTDKLTPGEAARMVVGAVNGG
jgi:cytidylate kinase